MFLAALTILGNWKMFQTAGEKLSDLFFTWVGGWLKARPKRQLQRRFGSDEELDRVLDHEREEVEKLVLLLKDDHTAGRVTLMQYQWPQLPSEPAQAKCLHEARELSMSSMLVYYRQFRALEPALQDLVQQIHCSPSRWLYIADTRKLANTTVRSLLLRWGVRSAYYQALPDSAGHCGGMLSVSWAQPKELTDEHLVELQWRGRYLGSMLRTLWACAPAESTAVAKV